MNTTRTAACLALLSITIACSSVAPVRVMAGDQCFRCRRYISNERLATETIVGSSSYFVSKFRGPGCMAKYIVAHPDDKPVIYVTDYASAKMMRPDAAFYVPEIVDRNTGETEYRAYRLRADADAAAADLHTTPLSWDAVLDAAR
jgi:hypothetical protein